MVEELATEHILDGREWTRIRETLMTIRGLLFSRINELTSKPPFHYIHLSERLPRKAFARELVKYVLGRYTNAVHY